MRAPYHSVLLALLALSSATHVVGQDAYLTNFQLPRFVKTATDHPIAVRVRNSSSTPVFTFRVDWRWNNEPVNEGPWQSTTGITGNQYWPYPHPVAFARPVTEAGVLKVWVVAIGEVDASDDTLRFPLTAISGWSEKSTLIDAWTATWCPNCPPANSTTNLLAADPRVIIAKHHAVDEYSDASSSEYFGQYNVTFTPAGVFDQGEYGGYAPNPNYDQWGLQLTDRAVGVSPAAVEVTATINAWTRELTATLNTTFGYAPPGEFTVNAYVVEDNVAGAQNNAPPGYVHQQVVRRVLGGTSGETNVVPTSPAVGTSYTKTWSMEVPLTWDLNDLRVIGYVTNRQNGTAYTLNVGTTGLTPVGVDEFDTGSGPYSVGPNPSVDELWIQGPGTEGMLDVHVMTVRGQAVLHERMRMNGSSMRVVGADQLAAGAYVVRLEGNGFSQALRWMRSSR